MKITCRGDLSFTAAFRDVLLYDKFNMFYNIKELFIKSDYTKGKA